MYMFALICFQPHVKLLLRHFSNIHHKGPQQPWPSTTFSLHNHGHSVVWTHGNPPLGFFLCPLNSITLHYIITEMWNVENQIINYQFVKWRPSLFAEARQSQILSAWVQTTLKSPCSRWNFRSIQLRSPWHFLHKAFLKTDQMPHSLRHLQVWNYGINSIPGLQGTLCADHRADTHSLQRKEFLLM